MTSSRPASCWNASAAREPKSAGNRPRIGGRASTSNSSRSTCPTANSTSSTGDVVQRPAPVPPVAIAPATVAPAADRPAATARSAAELTPDAPMTPQSHLPRDFAVRYTEQRHIPDDSFRNVIIQAYASGLSPRLPRQDAPYPQRARPNQSRLPVTLLRSVSWFRRALLPAEAIRAAWPLRRLPRRPRAGACLSMAPHAPSPSGHLAAGPRAAAPRGPGL